MSAKAGITVTRLLHLVLVLLAAAVALHPEHLQPWQNLANVLDIHQALGQNSH